MLIFFKKKIVQRNNEFIPRATKSITDDQGLSAIFLKKI
jgi:hypothetical protein